MRWVVAFGRFWYDFIVGDSIVLAIGGPAIIGLAYLVLQSGGTAVDEIVLPALVVATLALSVVWRRS